MNLVYLRHSLEWLKRAWSNGERSSTALCESHELVAVAAKVLAYETSLTILNSQAPLYPNDLSPLNWKGTNLIQVLLFYNLLCAQGLVWCCPPTRVFLVAATVEGDATVAGSTERTVQPVLWRCASLQAGRPQEHYHIGREERGEGRGIAEILVCFYVHRLRTGLKSLHKSFLGMRREVLPTIKRKAPPINKMATPTSKMTIPTNKMTTLTVRSKRWWSLSMSTSGHASLIMAPDYQGRMVGKPLSLTCHYLVVQHQYCPAGVATGLIHLITPLETWWVCVVDCSISDYFCIVLGT